MTYNSEAELPSHSLSHTLQTDSSQSNMCDENFIQRETDTNSFNEGYCESVISGNSKSALTIETIMIPTEEREEHTNETSINGIENHCIEDSNKNKIVEITECNETTNYKSSTDILDCEHPTCDNTSNNAQIQTTIQDPLQHSSKPNLTYKEAPYDIISSKQHPLDSNIVSLQKQTKPNNDGSLLRLFQSELFDTYFHMYYLYHRQEPGIQDYLVNLLYRRSEGDIHFYLPQLCCLCLARFKTSTLYRFILEKASKSMHLALKTSWLFHASSDDSLQELKDISIQLNQEVEMAIVNSKPVPPGTTAYSPSLDVYVPDLFERRRAISKLQNTQYISKRTPSIICPEAITTTIIGGTTGIILPPEGRTVGDIQSDPGEETQHTITEAYNDNTSKSIPTSETGSFSTSPVTSSIRLPPAKQRIASGFVRRVSTITLPGAKIKLPSVYTKLGSPFSYSSFRDTALMDAEMQQYIVKQRRCDYYNTVNGFTSTIIDVSNRLSQEPDRGLRLTLVQQFFHALNEWMFCRRCIVAASEGTFTMTGLNIPLSEFGSLNSSNTHSTQIVRFLPNECRVLSSKKRAPYLLVFEVADLDEDLHQLPSIFRLTTTEFSKAVMHPTDSKIEGRQNSLVLSKSMRSTAATPLWNHLYVYNCILDELKERNLYKPCVGNGHDSSSSESPLTALRRSMGLKTHSRRILNRGVSVASAPNDDLFETNIIPHEPVESIIISPNITSCSPIDEKSSIIEDHVLKNVSLTDTLHQHNTESITNHLSSLIGDGLDHEITPSTKETETLSIDTLDPLIIKDIHKLSELHPDTTIDQDIDKESNGLPMSQMITDPSDIVVSKTNSFNSEPSFIPPLVTTSFIEDNTVTQHHSTNNSSSSSSRPNNDSRRRSFTPAILSRRSVSPVSLSKSVDLGGTNLASLSPDQSSRPSTLSNSMFSGTGYSTLSSIFGKATGVLSTTQQSLHLSKTQRHGRPVFDTTRTNDMTAVSLSPVNSFRDVVNRQSSQEVNHALLSERQVVPHENTVTPEKPIRSQSTSLIDNHILTPLVDMTDRSVPSEEPISSEQTESYREITQASPADRAAQANHLRFKLWGTLWKDKKQKYKDISPYGKLKSWNLGCVLVKGGDDVRQEMLASQLIRQFKWIFEEARLPLYLRPYEILVTGANSGIMVFVPDTISIDSLKKTFGSDSICKVFEAAFADNPYQAKKNFIESHAAYSIIAYLLQVKDRHNGNYLLDAEGHVIHIDYGFMLSNSPGNVNFESSPFKLTAEFMDIMDGEISDNYEYFRTLVVRGFLESRKHVDRLLLLVEMMLSATKMPCFSAGPEASLAAFKDRFMLNYTEEMCIQKIVDLIDASVNNWRTIQYDNFQRITNGIM